ADESKSGSRGTRRWKEADSNPRSPSEGEVPATSNEAVSRRGLRWRGTNGRNPSPSAGESVRTTSTWRAIGRRALDGLWRDHLPPARTGLALFEIRGQRAEPRVR